MRILHTMLRVNDLAASKVFYCEVLGMKLLREKEYPEGKFTLAFVGYDDEASSSVIELTYNWEAPVNQDGYSHGTGYGHIAIGVPNVPAMCALLDAGGVEVTVQPKVLFAGGPSLAFVKDPDGYNIELIQTSKLYPGIAAS